MKNNSPISLPIELVELGNLRWQELQAHAQFSADFETFEEQINQRNDL